MGAIITHLNKLLRMAKRTACWRKRRSAPRLQSGLPFKNNNMPVDQFEIP